jgi:hypothetical protein
MPVLAEHIIQIQMRRRIFFVLATKHLSHAIGAQHRFASNKHSQSFAVIAHLEFACKYDYLPHCQVNSKYCNSEAIQLIAPFIRVLHLPKIHKIL